MPSKTEALCAALGAHVVAELPGVQHSYGADELDLASDGADGVIVWRVLQAQHGPTRSPGGNPRQLVERIVEIEAHLWGADNEATERLLEAVTRAIWRELPGASANVREDWSGETDTARTHNRRGALVLLTFTARIPISATPLVTKKIADVAFDTTTSSPTDGHLDAGEPA